MQVIIIIIIIVIITPKETSYMNVFNWLCSSSLCPFWRLTRDG
jgi:hypothetical protein